MSVRLAIAEADLSTLNVAAFCREHHLSRDRFYALRRRYDAEGVAGLEPRSRAPLRVANRTPDAVEDLIVATRKDLDGKGFESGPGTIAVHLREALPEAAIPSESTIWRVLTRRGYVIADPSKAPNKPVRSFCAERANECWQIDDTGWTLADGTDVKIINIIDDCTRVCVASIAVHTCTGTEALNTFALAAAHWGQPQRFLSDNAKAFRHVLAPALRELGIKMGHSRPYHPQTCGKVERFHQTLKKHLATRPPAATIAELQTQLDHFRDYYNHQRPHRSIDRRTPAGYWQTTPKSGPANQPITAPTTVSINTVSNGCVEPTQHLKIAVGAAHTGQQATTIRTGLHAHVFINGQLIRALTIDPTRRYQNLKPRPTPPTA